MQLFLDICYTRVRKGKINERQCAYKSTVVCAWAKTSVWIQRRCVSSVSLTKPRVTWEESLNEELSTSFG